MGVHGRVRFPGRRPTLKRVNVVSTKLTYEKIYNACLYAFQNMTHEDIKKISWFNRNWKFIKKVK